MYRGAFISETELDLVRTIKNVVRLRHVRRIDHHTITLDQGQVPTSPRSLHIHCAARALPRPELRPMFEPGRITVQPFMRGLACFQFAMVGVAEALLNTDEEKNHVLPPINYWDSTRDSLTSLLAGVAHAKARAEYPALAAWANTSRLNPMGDLGPYRDHPDVRRREH